jgi:4-amino-4-deoxy-L-arabinose transferase-like glycosyltransferase
MSRDTELATSLGITEPGSSRLASVVARPTMKWLTGAAILLMYLALGLYLVALQDRPEAYDTAGYLMEANRIAEHGGVTAFPQMIVEGKWEQANQHPLYILAITPFAEFDFGFVKSAQFVSLFFGVLAVLAGYMIALRYFTPLVAALGVTGFALTQLWIKWSTLVACESLLILLSIVGMTAVFAGFRDRRYWILAGFTFGAAFFTKVTALLLLPGFFLAVLLKYRSQIFRIREVYLFLVAFLIGCSPLLVSNLIVHGVPYYNVNFDNLSGGRGEIAYHETGIEHGSMIRVYVDDASVPADRASPDSGANRVVGLATRSLSRLPRQFTLLLETLSPWPLHATPKAFRWVMGLAILGLFLVGILREPNKNARNYMLATFGVFLLALTLHRPIARYLLPLHFFIWIYAAMGVVFLIYRYGDRLRIDRSILASFIHVGVTSCCAMLAFYIFGTKSAIARAPDALEISPHRHELVEWMRANIGKDDRYVEGPNWRWVLEDGTHIFPPYPARISATEFVEFVRNNDIRYVIAETKSMNLWRYRGTFDRRLQFEGILDFEAESGIDELDVPSEWTKVAADEEGAVNYIVYEVEDASK